MVSTADFLCSRNHFLPLPSGLRALAALCPSRVGTTQGPCCPSAGSCMVPGWPLRPLTPRRSGVTLQRWGEGLCSQSLWQSEQWVVSGGGGRALEQEPAEGPRG